MLTAGAALCLCALHAQASGGSWRAVAKAAADAAIKEAIPETVEKAPDGVVATIGGVSITQSELSDRLNTLVAIQQAGLKNGLSDRAKNALKTQLQKSALADMVDMQLLDQVATKKGIETSKTSAESALEPLKAIAKTQGLDFDAFCATRLGVSSAQITDYFTRKAKAQEILESEVRSRVTVSDGEIDAWLKTNPDSNRTAAERVIRLQKTATASAEYLAALRGETSVSVK